MTTIAIIDLKNIHEVYEKKMLTIRNIVNGLYIFGNMSLF